MKAVASRRDELVPADQINSAAVPLFSRLIPLFGRQIPLFGGVAEFRQYTNEINNLRARISPAIRNEQPFLLFFPLEQGNPVVVFGP
jgi:hypothetical protein